MNDTKTQKSDRSDMDSKARIIPRDPGFAFRPFDNATAATKKCYVIFDPGPPKVLTEVPCGDIIIVETQDALQEGGEFSLK